MRGLPSFAGVLLPMRARTGCAMRLRVWNSGRWPHYSLADGGQLPVRFIPANDSRVAGNATTADGPVRVE